jgi:mitochondrial chaperone BCS1
MHYLFEWFMAHAVQNQVFSGVIGAGLIGTVVYALKSVPMTILGWIQWSTTTRVMIVNDVADYEHIAEWLGARMKQWYVRNLMLQQEMKDDDGMPVRIGHGKQDVANRYNLTPGYGAQWLFLGRWPYKIDRAVENKEHATKGRTRETITITTIGFSRKRINFLIDQALSGIVTQKGINVFTYIGWWDCLEKRTPRPLDSIVLPDAMVETLTSDVERFLGSAPQYIKRGIPYRRGYLFCGPPGTGKSSLAIALAGHYQLPIYVLNLGSVGSDQTLIEAAGGVPNHGILLIEDIDATKVALVRKEDDDTEQKGVTLSGLLNCLDGIVAKEGRILIMTSNHPERLDPALIRPGRVDRRVEFGLASADEATRLFLRFFDDDTESANWLSNDYTIRQSAAEIQGHCQNFEGNPLGAAQAICSYPRIAQIASCG